MNLQVNGLWGLLILAADIWALVHIVQSPASIFQKVLWSLLVLVLVLVLPVLGLLLWFFLGPRAAKA